jgi:hypothetical protein
MPEHTYLQKYCVNTIRKLPTAVLLLVQYTVGTAVLERLNCAISDMLDVDEGTKYVVASQLGDL